MIAWMLGSRNVEAPRVSPRPARRSWRRGSAVSGPALGVSPTIVDRDGSTGWFGACSRRFP